MSNARASGWRCCTSRTTSAPLPLTAEEKAEGVMASLMSVLPVWQHVDPLHVLDGIVDDDDDDESLQEMIERTEKEHDEAQFATNELAIAT